LREFDVPVASGRLHAQEFGPADAPLAIGVHGLTLNMKMFDYLGEHLGDGLRLVAVDLRGRGKSQTLGTGFFGWENHARDVLALADFLGAERFSLIGQSMGGSIGMKLAELDVSRLESLVLVDVAGRVDPGIGAAISRILSGVGRVYPSVEDLVAAARSAGFVTEWNEYWDRCYRYGVVEEGGGYRSPVSATAVDEDRIYGLTQNPYERWRFLTMPVLLLRASQELAAGSGFAVPADDVTSFLAQVERSSAVEIEANHLTINTHPDMVGSVRSFLDSVGRS
jgi:pimeloyl-ACP methyl ester carboxylesterase